MYCTLAEPALWDLYIYIYIYIYTHGSISYLIDFSEDLLGRVKLQSRLRARITFNGATNCPPAAAPIESKRQDIASARRKIKPNLCIYTQARECCNCRSINAARCESKSHWGMQSRRPRSTLFQG